MRRARTATAPNAINGVAQRKTYLTRRVVWSIRVSSNQDFPIDRFLIDLTYGKRSSGAAAASPHSRDTARNRIEIAKNHAESTAKKNRLVSP